MFCIDPTWHLNVADCPGLAVTLFMIFWMFGFPHVLTEKERKNMVILYAGKGCARKKDPFLSIAAL